MTSNDYADPGLVYKSIKAALVGDCTHVVGIDGPDCSGKTTLANQICELASQDYDRVDVVHLDDSFPAVSSSPRKNPNPAAEMLLDFFDYTEVIFSSPLQRSLVIVEGMFLFRRSNKWKFDYTIRISLGEKEVFRRAEIRDLSLFENWGDFAQHYVSQCLVSQRIYVDLVRPQELADLVLDLGS